ncbi:hypothetical protein XENTR_v10005371 [Xenopus tropicalis]|nr:hypothetical protein XENTR_v10005371 [Xenopus tropicalis]
MSVWFENQGMRDATKELFVGLVVRGAWQHHRGQDMRQPITFSFYLVCSSICLKFAVSVSYVCCSNQCLQFGGLG